MAIGAVAISLLTAATGKINVGRSAGPPENRIRFLEDFSLASSFRTSATIAESTAFGNNGVPLNSFTMHRRMQSGWPLWLRFRDHFNTTHIWKPLDHTDDCALTLGRDDCTPFTLTVKSSDGDATFTWDGVDWQSDVTVGAPAFRMYNAAATFYAELSGSAVTENTDYIWPATDGDNHSLLHTNGSGDLTWEMPRSELMWHLRTNAGSGTFYRWGYYDFGATPNDFNPAANFGTSNAPQGGHFFIVKGATGGGTNATYEITGDSIDDEGNITSPDTATITVINSASSGTYYETPEKWNGQIKIEKIAGSMDRDVNYGLNAYYDRGKTDFTVTGVTCEAFGGYTDATADVKILHHNATGWTFQAAAPPDPPAAISSSLSTHGLGTVENKRWRWKRTDLSTAVEGSASEGIIVEIVTGGSGLSFEFGECEVVYTH